jgi:transposase
MKGRKRQEEPIFTYVRVEELVPQDHILRKIDGLIDFSCVHEKTKGLYSHTGRPSVDPEVLIRMMLIGYLYGITSERRLCQEVHLNLAYRWFCGFSLEDKVPDHSTFSKNRHGRFSGRGLFRELFYDSVQQARSYGLVRGTQVTVDATTIEANAALSSMEEIVVPFSAEEYLARVENENRGDERDDHDKKPPTRKRSNDTHRSTSDPDARLFRKPFQRTRLAYSDNILMDNASRIILDVEVTEPNIRQERQVAGEMVERIRFRFGITPETLAGDKAYGYGAAVRRICEAGVKPHVARHRIKPRNSHGIFTKDDFIYDRDRDELICPAGTRLHRRTEHARNRQSEYVASIRDCRQCALKEQCTRARYRVTHRHWDQDYLDYVEALRQTSGYRLSQRYRKKIESLFGEGKEQMGLRRAQRRGHENVTEQCFMTAMVQNIKRIIAAFDKRGVGGICAALKSGMNRISCAVDRITDSFLLLFARLRPEIIVV